MNHLKTKMIAEWDWIEERIYTRKLWERGARMKWAEYVEARRNIIYLNLLRARTMGYRVCTHGSTLRKPVYVHQCEECQEEMADVNFAD